jgi:hypothetical protein
MKDSKIQRCIDACEACIKTCETCSTANKDEEGMEHSVKLCLTCAAVCEELLAGIQNNSNTSDLYKKCEDFCTECATECEKHSHMQHCIDCAKACRACAEACKTILASAT